MDNVTQQQIEKKVIPTGVKIISVFYWIGGVLGILFGVLLLIGAGTIIEQIPLLSSIGESIFIIGGIIMLIFGILNVFIGRGLWKAQRWTRILVIIFSFLAIISAVYFIINGGVINGILNLLINGLICGYLLFSKNVKEAFAR